MTKMRLGNKGIWKYDTETKLIENSVTESAVIGMVEDSGSEKPVFKQDGGDVYVTIVDNDGEFGVVCELNKVYENFDKSKEIYCIVRRSPYNPDKVNKPEDAKFIGESHSNNRKIIGTPDKYYFTVLSKNPDPENCTVIPFEEFADTEEGFSATGMFKALVKMDDNDLAFRILETLRGYRIF